MDVTAGELVTDAGCVVCYEEVVETVLMPCRHMVVCKVGMSVVVPLGLC